MAYANYNSFKQGLLSHVNQAVKQSLVNSSMMEELMKESEKVVWNSGIRGQMHPHLAQLLTQVESMPEGSMLESQKKVLALDHLQELQKLLYPNQ